jgi:hypothetical protein
MLCEKLEMKGCLICGIFIGTLRVSSRPAVVILLINLYVTDEEALVVFFYKFIAKMPLKCFFFKFYSELELLNLSLTLIGFQIITFENVKSKSLFILLFVIRSV